MDQTIAAAVIGTGFIGPVHVEGLRRAGVPVRGVYDADRAKARRLVDQLGLERVYERFEDVLADASVQSVHIATPNRLHYEMARAALEAGKHVMCEKPLAMDSRQSAELVQLARRSGRAAGVNYNIRFYPLCREMAEQVRSGALGELFHVTGSYVQDWLLYPTDFNWRVLAEEGGPLRAVADIGTHWLDLAQSVTGRKVTAVCADLHTVMPVRQRPRGDVETFSGKGKPPVDREPVQIDTEDCGFLLLRLEGGAGGVVHVSQVTAGRKNCLRLEIAGSRRSLAWNSERPNQLWIGRRDQPNGLLLRDPALLAEPAAGLADYPGGHNEGFPDTFKQCFRAFYEYIAAGDLTAPAPFPTFADGHREILLCEAVLASHRQQGWVNVEQAEKDREP